MSDKQKELELLLEQEESNLTATGKNRLDELIEEMKQS